MADKTINQEAGTINNIETINQAHINHANINIHNENGKGKGKRVSKKFVALISVTILVIISVITPVSVKLYRIVSDRRNGEVAKSVFKSAGDKNDYLTGAHRYHALLIDTYDSDLQVLFEALEAYMYCMHATTSKTDNKTDIEKHLNSALLCVDSVKKQIDDNSWIYAFACAIESECYYALNISPEDDKWRKAISKLELYVDNARVELDDFYSPMVFEYACHTLTLYFQKVALNKELFDKYGENTLNQKMRKYQQLYTETYNRVADKFGLRLGIFDFSVIQDFYDTELNDIAIILARADSEDVNAMINDRLSGLKRLDDVIDGCRSRLAQIDYNKNNELAYLYFTRLTARALYYKHIICQILEDVEGQKLVAKECREIVVKVLRLSGIDNEDSLFEISCISDYIFIMDEFQLDDALYYYDRQTKLMKTQKYANLSSSEKKNVQLSTCYNCMATLEKYGYNEKIYTFGLNCARELMDYASLVPNASDEDEVKGTALYFLTYQNKVLVPDVSADKIVGYSYNKSLLPYIKMLHEKDFDFEQDKDKDSILKAFAAGLLDGQTSVDYDSSSIINNLMSLLELKKKIEPLKLPSYYLLCATESRFYTLLDIPVDDKAWVKVVSELEDFVEKHPFVSLSSVTSSDSFVFDDGEKYSAHIQACMSLALYFRKVSHLGKDAPEIQRLSVTYDEALSKMVYYQKLFTDNFLQVRHDMGLRSTQLDQVFLADFYEVQLEAVRFKIDYFLSDDKVADKRGMMQELDGIINNSKQGLQRISYNDNTKSLYVRLNCLIVHAVASEYDIYKDNDDSMGMTTSANLCNATMARVLRQKDSIVDEDSFYRVFFACEDFFYIGQYEMKDVEDFCDIVSKLLETDRYKSSSSQDKEDMQCRICSSCKRILEQRGYNERVYKLAVENVKALRSYIDINVEDPNEEDILRWYKFFTEYEVKVK